jgi:hypothetical protein
MWDSGMTEGRDQKAVDLMHRQGLLGGIKVPVLWSLAGVAKALNDAADVDYGYPGTASYGIETSSTMEDLKNMPWAMRYVSRVTQLETCLYLCHLFTAHTIVFLCVFSSSVRVLSTESVKKMNTMELVGLIATMSLPQTNRSPNPGGEVKLAMDRS